MLVTVVVVPTPIPATGHKGALSPHAASTCVLCFTVVTLAARRASFPPASPGGWWRWAAFPGRLPVSPLLEPSVHSLPIVSPGGLGEGWFGLAFCSRVLGVPNVWDTHRL